MSLSSMLHERLDPRHQILIFLLHFPSQLFIADDAFPFPRVLFPNKSCGRRQHLPFHLQYIGQIPVLMGNFVVPGSDQGLNDLIPTSMILVDFCSHRIFLLAESKENVLVGVS